MCITSFIALLAYLPFGPDFSFFFGSCPFIILMSSIILISYVFH